MNVQSFRSGHPIITLPPGEADFLRQATVSWPPRLLDMVLGGWGPKRGLGGLGLARRLREERPLPQQRPHHRLPSGLRPRALGGVPGREGGRGRGDPRGRDREGGTGPARTPCPHWLHRSGGLKPRNREGKGGSPPPGARRGHIRGESSVLGRTATPIPTGRERVTRPRERPWPGLSGPRPSSRSSSWVAQGCALGGGPVNPPPKNHLKKTLGLPVQPPPPHAMLSPAVAPPPPRGPLRSEPQLCLPLKRSPVYFYLDPLFWGGLPQIGAVVTGASKHFSGGGAGCRFI